MIHFYLSMKAITMVNLHLLTTHRKKIKNNQNCFKSFCITLSFFIQDMKIGELPKAMLCFIKYIIYISQTQNSSGICLRAEKTYVFSKYHTFCMTALVQLQQVQIKNLDSNSNPTLQKRFRISKFANF